jgi:hypothetical protein
VLITEEMEQRLEHQDRRRQEHLRTVANIATVVWWLSPQIALHVALTDLAGTGASRHQAFLREVRHFQLQLRAFVYPRVLDAVRPAAASGPCRNCPGRLTFVDYDAIPRFTMEEPGSATRVASALRTAGWLGLLATIVAVAGIGGATKWAPSS